MDWLRVTLGLINLANYLAKAYAFNQALALGDARATARQMAEISKRLGISKQVAAEVAAMSDADLDAALKGN